MQLPRVSIITPVFNGEKFMQECIENVISQECYSLEHVIVDGMSTDKTPGIIKKYAEKYDHVKWITEKDNGQSEAQNKGIKIARGSIISFLNVDDFYEPGVLNRILGIFETLPEPALLVGNCNVWDDDGHLRRVCRPKRLMITDLLMGYAINPHPANPSSYFYHRSLHETVGEYDTGLEYNMDQDFIFKAVQKANVKYIDEIWGNFRLIKGDKTYQSVESGLIHILDKQNYEKYLAQVPRFIRVIVIAKRFVHYRLRELCKRFCR